MSRRNGIILSYVYTVLNMVAGLFLSSFLIRVLGDTEYGLYQTITAFAMYLVMLEFGTGTAMTRNILVERNSKNDKKKLNSIISTLMIMTFILVMVILLIAIIFYISIPSIYAKTMTHGQIEYGRKIFAVIVFYLLASFITQTISGILMGFENYTIGQKINIFKLLFRTGLVISVLLVKPYSIYIALIDCFISVVVLIFTIIYVIKMYEVKFKFSLFDLQIVKSTMPLCIALLIQVIVNQANNSVDKFLIGIMISMESVAIYSVAQYIYSVFSSITTVPITMYMPQVARDIGKGLQGLDLTKSLVQPCRLVALLGGSIVFGFFAVGKQFITILYGTDKVMAWVYALIIMLPMLINMTNGILVNVLDILNKRMSRSYALLFTTIINIVLSIWLLKRIGILGAVLATAIATILGQIIIMNIYYERKIGIKVMYLFKEAFRGILAYQILASFISYFVVSHIANVYVAFFLGGITFVVVFGGLYFWKGTNEYEKQLVKKLIKKVKKKKE